PCEMIGQAAEEQSCAQSDARALEGLMMLIGSDDAPRDAAQDGSAESIAWPLFAVRLRAVIPVWIVISRISRTGKARIVERSDVCLFAPRLVRQCPEQKTTARPDGHALGGLATAVVPNDAPHDPAHGRAGQAFRGEQLRLCR